MKALDEVNEDLKVFIKDIVSRVESLESAAIVVEYDITKLTPSDDLEKVKAKINEIIDILSRD